MLLAVAGTLAPDPRRGHQHQGRPASASLRVVAPAAPLRLPRRRASPCRTSCGPASSSSAPPRRTLFWWSAWIARGRRGPGVAGRPAGVAQPAPPAAGDLGRPRGRGRRGRSTSPAATLHRLQRRGRPVLHLAVPRPARAGPARTPTPSPPRRTGAACGSPSRASVTAASSRRRFVPARASLVEGPYGRLSAARPHPPQGGASSAPGSASPRCARWPRGWPTARARRSTSSASRDEPLFARELDHPGPRARAPRAAAARPPPGTRLLAGEGHRHGRRPQRPAPLGPRHRRARRLRLRARAAGPTCVARTSLAAGPPPEHIHLETFAW